MSARPPTASLAAAVAAAAVLALAGTAPGAGADEAPCTEQPPRYGAWHVDEPVVCRDGAVEVRPVGAHLEFFGLEPGLGDEASVVVEDGGSLTLENVTLTVDRTFAPASLDLVARGGPLNVTGSTVAAEGSDTYAVHARENVTLEDSRLEDLDAVHLAFEAGERHEARLANLTWEACCPDLRTDSAEDGRVLVADTTLARLGGPDDTGTGLDVRLRDAALTEGHAVADRDTTYRFDRVEAGTLSVHAPADANTTIAGTVTYDGLDTFHEDAAVTRAFPVQVTRADGPPWRNLTEVALREDATGATREGYATDAEGLLEEPARFRFEGAGASATYTPLVYGQPVDRVNGEAGGAVGLTTDTWDPATGRRAVVAATATNLTVVDVDVGQAGALAVHRGDWTAVYDTGDRWESSYGGLVDHLDARGVERVDQLVVSHPHADHAGGCDAVIETYEVGRLYHPGVSYDTQTWQDCLDAADTHGVPVTTGHDLAIGDRLPDTAAALEVVHVDPTASDVHVANLALRLEFGAFSFAFTGDLECPTENRTIGYEIQLEAEVFNLGHHGSRTSTCNPWLDALDPTAATVSVGEDNQYGHPHEAVLDRLADHGVPLYRTDQDGDVTVTTDGRSWEIGTEKG